MKLWIYCWIHLILTSRLQNDTTKLHWIGKNWSLSVIGQDARLSKVDLKPLFFYEECFFITEPANGKALMSEGGGCHGDGLFGASAPRPVLWTRVCEWSLCSGSLIWWHHHRLPKKESSRSSSSTWACLHEPPHWTHSCRHATMTHMPFNTQCVCVCDELRTRKEASPSEVWGEEKGWVTSLVRLLIVTAFCAHG